MPLPSPSRTRSLPPCRDRAADRRRTWCGPLAGGGEWTPTTTSPCRCPSRRRRGPRGARRRSTRRCGASMRPVNRRASPPTGDARQGRLPGGARISRPQVGVLVSAALGRRDRRAGGLDIARAISPATFQPETPPRAHWPTLAAPGSTAPAPIARPSAPIMSRRAAPTGRRSARRRPSPSAPVIRADSGKASCASRLRARRQRPSRASRHRLPPQPSKWRRAMRRCRHRHLHRQRR